MEISKKGQISIIALGVIILVGQASAAQALTIDKSVYITKVGRPTEHREKNDRHDWDKSKNSSFVFSFSVGGLSYYYSDGRYYCREGRDYRRVGLPYGKVIYTLPAGYRTHYYRGEPYYWHNGVCFKRYRGGYRIVETPVDFTYVSRYENVQPTYEPVLQDHFTVNIPNQFGGYTGILIKRSGDGFVGPQGEYYSEFPSVEQLKLMYGK